MNDDLKGWILVSADGGNRWYLGKPTSNGTPIVTLDPAYEYGVTVETVGARTRLTQFVSPILSLGSHVKLAIDVKLLVLVDDLDSHERRGIAGLVKEADAKKKTILHAVSATPG